MLVTRIKILIKQDNLFKSIANIFTEVFDKTKEILYRAKKIKISEYLCNMPLNYKAHGVWRYFTERLLLCLPSGPLALSLVREDFRSAERYVRLKQTPRMQR